MDDIEMQLAEMDIENEENENLVFEEEIEEESNRFELCLVGRFLTEKNINVRAMKSKLADVWKPAMGINIKDLKPGIFLFQFYHKDDLNWVLSNGPWTYDNALLVTNIIKTGEDPTKTPLVEVDFWIQIHNLPVGYMTETVGRQLGNFFGTFLQYDSKNNSSIWREFMRLRVRLDVRKPLKRKKKICKKDKSEVVVHCKYEKLADFCFVCGSLSHTERFCKKKLEAGKEEIVKEWGQWLRAQPRRMGGGSTSKWLREEGDEEWGREVGRQSRTQQAARFQRPDNPGKSHYESGNSKQKAKEASKTCEDTGLDSEELYGLKLEERKRQRSDTHTLSTQMEVNGTTPKDPTLSGTDCVETSQSILAQLAGQASQLK